MQDFKVETSNFDEDFIKFYKSYIKNSFDFAFDFIFIAYFTFFRNNRLYF